MGGKPEEIREVRIERLRPADIVAEAEAFGALYQPLGAVEYMLDG